MKYLKRDWHFAFAVVIAILSIFVLMQGICFASNTSSAPVLTISVPDVVQGDEFTSTLYFERGSKVCSAALTFSYDAEKSELISCVPNEDSLVEATINTTVDGQVTITFATGRNISAELPLVDFTFRVKDDLAEGEFDLIQLSGQSNYVRRLNSDNIAENIDFDFETPQAKIYMAGDINLDGSVDGMDAVYILRYEAGLNSGREGSAFYLPYYSDISEYDDHQKYMLEIADAYFDEEVNGSDAVSILRYEAGFTNEILGNRVNVRFFDADSNLYTKRTVVFGTDLTRLPAVPEREGYSGGQWSAESGSFVAPILTGIEAHMDLYAVYDAQVSDAMAFYKRQLTSRYYSEDLQNNLNGDLTLIGELIYQSGYHASVIWTSSNNATLNAADKGQFSRPTYDETVTLTAHITSYNGTLIEMEDTIDFEYSVRGVFQAPSKSVVLSWLNTFFENGVNYDLKLPQKITNEDIESNLPFELRITWEINDNGTFVPISQIERSSQNQIMDLVATVTFNGVPLEDDGKVYFDDLSIKAISEFEIRSYIIEQISNNVPMTLTNGWELWHTDSKYGTTINWLSRNTDIAVVENNSVVIDNSAVNGTLLPLTAQVTYLGADGQASFDIAYTVSVQTTNSLLVAGVNIDEMLYAALKDATDTNGNLTTDVLKDNRFVYLDLSGYPDLTNLSGLSYCKNLRVLNISGLRIEQGINEIATLNHLEALIARGCGLSNLSDGGVAVLKNAINLRMLDLSFNDFTSLDSVLDSSVRYGKLNELYLNDNNLQDLSGLSRAPALSVLVLSNNNLTTEDVSSIGSFKFLVYLSLADNNIQELGFLKNLRHLKELRLQNNAITDVRDLKTLTSLEALYLGNNNISTNISFLNYLTELKVLYLNNNNIDSISALTDLEHIEAINVSGNNIDSLGILDNYKTTLKEVYAEDNEIATFAFAKNLTGLRVLMLSGNVANREASLGSYLSGLTQLETLTLSGKPISDLSFLSGMNKLVRLDIAYCDLPSYFVNGSSILVNENNGTRMLEISNYTDNMALLLGRKEKLQFLDITGNNLAYYTDEVLEYMQRVQGANITDVIGLSFTDAIPSPIESLYELSKLMVLYADNVNKVIDASSLTALMTDLRYLSLENAGITDISWLSKFRLLKYVDLANNPIVTVDLGSNISARSKDTLKYLYLDTTADQSVFVKAYNSFDENALVELSLAGINVGDMSKLPYMDNLEYLNISSTGISDLQGVEPDFYDVQTIARFYNLKVLDVSHIPADISCLLNLNSLETVYAISNPNELLFYNVDLTALYNLFNNGITCYLYDYETEYAPVAADEGLLILNEIKDITGTVKVAADNVLSDNNPELLDSVNDFDITWTVSNTTNYEVSDGHVKVKSYSGLEDEVLTVTATIRVYPDQATVKRDFTLNMSVLRVNADPSDSTKYLNYYIEGYSSQLQRTNEFNYDITLKSAQTDGFSSPVKPVEDNITYSYSAKLASGTSEQYTNIVSIGNNHNYTVLNNAPLNAVLTITIDVTHDNKSGARISDLGTPKTIQITVVGRTNTVTFVLDGGTLVDSNGTPITQLSLSEDSLIFDGLTVSKNGYAFEGWYRDSNFQTFFSNGNDNAVMPAENITLYAKWRAVRYTITFNPNGGSVSPTTQTALSGTPIGTLPTPTRTGFRFDGWFTSATGGTQVTASTVFNSADPVTLYAHWTVLSYTVSWSAGTNYTVAVSRTNSPNGNASTGSLGNGAVVYYGDILSVTYTPATGYSVGSHGASTITVTKNITSSDIYATASANSYTYNVVYVSSNGTDLGSATVTHAYGTTNTITPPEKAGYVTPDAQSVVWNSTSAKTITFTYTPVVVGVQTLKENQWWWHNGTSSTGIKYTVTAEMINRTADSVQIKITWDNWTNTTGTYFGYQQFFTMIIGGISSGEQQIANASKFGQSTTGSIRHAIKTVTVTVTGLTADQTSVDYSCTTRCGGSHPDPFSGTITIPTY